MSSAFWLLLYLAPLLGLTAALFAWFGWQWRGSDLLKRIKELLSVVEEERVTRKKAESERDSQRDELNRAHETSRRHADDAAKACESAKAIETETHRLLRDMETLRAERDQTASALKSAQAELEQLRAQPAVIAAPAPVGSTPPPAEKPKRKRTTTVKTPKAAPATATLGEKISALETQLASHQSAVSALTQEHDDWQRRVSKLEGKTPADPAGLALARRSLADSEKRLHTATTEIERLRNQVRVLNRAGEKSAALASVADDDLTRIKGIKKIINEQLRAHGIRTWRQIAQWDEEELRVFSELLAFKNRASREKWQEQARALHETAHGPLS